MSAICANRTAGIGVPDGEPRIAVVQGVVFAQTEIPQISLDPTAAEEPRRHKPNRRRRQPGPTVTVLLSVMSNPQFPQPTSNAGDGVNINWSRASINSFATLMTAAKANGWIITTASLPTFPFAEAAVMPIGSYYLPAASDPLFDT